MNAYGEERTIVLLAKFRMPQGVLHCVGRKDDGPNARRPDLFPSSGKVVIFIREMGVYVDHLTIAPLSTNFSGEMSDRPFSSSAHKIMPSESTPRSLTGFKFVTTTTFFPTISSGL